MLFKKSVLGFAKSAIMVRNKAFFLPTVEYKQGQIIERNIREYFYYIDHDGRLYMDNVKSKNFTTCLRDPQFLKFFFDRLKFNCTPRYEQQFPFLMTCGRDRNFVRCEDTPIVFTQHLTVKGCDKLGYNHNGSMMMVDYHPENLYVNHQNGRLYHPAWPNVGNIGLMSSNLAMQVAEHLIFSNGKHSQPTQLIWKGQRVRLNTDWIKDTRVYGLRSKVPIVATCDCSF